MVNVCMYIFVYTVLYVWRSLVIFYLNKGNIWLNKTITSWLIMIIFAFFISGKKNPQNITLFKKTNKPHAHIHLVTS